MITPYDCLNPSGRSQRVLYIFRCIFLACRWRNACLRQPSVRWQCLVQVHSGLEVIHNLLLRFISRVAGWLQCAYAGPMLVPFVIPQLIIIAPIRLPMLVHVGEELSLAGCADDGADVCVRTRMVTVGVIAAIAVVGPGTREPKVNEE